MIKNIIILVLVIGLIFLGYFLYNSRSVETEKVAPVETIDLKSDLIRVTSPNLNAQVSSPLLITGEARGYWYFEASFPIEVVDSKGNVLGKGIAQAKEEWMTENFVPFEALITFSKPFTETRGKIILHKDNPSGLPEHDNSLEIPIRFE